jgi:RNA polymerase sigma factor (sigma-70 family)
VGLCLSSDQTTAPMQYEEMDSRFPALEGSASHAQDAQGRSFLDHETTLWRTIAHLVRRGYFIPPDQARDVIHDFYLDAWQGVLERYDSTKGGFDTYLVSAFYRFAQRKSMEMAAWRNKLVDVELALEQASTEPTPPEQLERKDEARKIRLAFDGLPGDERQVLYEFIGDGRHSERAIAQKHGTTRYAVRRTLAAGIANLSRELSKVGIDPLHAQISQGAWRDGRRSTDIARTFNLPAELVAKVRSDLARSVVEVVHETAVVKGFRSKNMNATEALKSLLFSDNIVEKLRSASEEDSHRLAALLTEESVQDLKLSDEQLRQLARQPWRLGELYEAAFPSEATALENMDPLENALVRYEASESRDSIYALEVLLTFLPDEFQQWDKYFGPLKRALGSPGRTSEVEAAATPNRSRVLLAYGLTHAVFVEAYRGLQLLFDLRQETGGYTPKNERRVIQLAGERSPIYVTYEDMIAQLRETPGLPISRSGPNPRQLAAEGLANWTLDILDFYPALIPGYRVVDAAKSEGLMVLVRDPSPGKVNLADRWKPHFLLQHVELLFEGANDPVEEVTRRPGMRA